MDNISSIYRYACPNCGGPIDDYRLELGVPCDKCLPVLPESISREQVYKMLVKNGRLSRDYEILHKQWRLTKKFEVFFEKAVGSKPWGAQRTWARRLARRDSFSIIAPTGVGKTTFGLVYSVFLACRKHGKSYVILPTTPLVVQALKKLHSLMESANCHVRVAYYHSRMKKSEKEKMLDTIKKGDFDILVTTVAFARSKIELVEGKNYHLVFVDDVDAVLRSGKSISAVLRIVGFPVEVQEKGLELYYTRRRIVFLSSRNGDLEEIARLEKKAGNLENYIEKYRRRASSLMVSSATGRPRGVKAKLFRFLLGFEVGGRGDIGVRRIIDTFTIPKEKEYSDDAVISIVKKLGVGGLVFVPIDKGVSYSEELVEKMKQQGIQAEAFHAKKNISLLEKFEEGEIDVLVGVANYYGVLVRGLDMPWRVKYAVFAGVPRMKFSAKIEEPHPLRIARLLGLVAEVLEGDLKEEAMRYLAALRRVIRRLSPAALQIITEKLIEGDEGLPGSLERIVIRSLAFLRQAFSSKDVWEKLREKGDVGIVEEEGGLYLLIPDPYTYLQASGRTSRLYAGGITLGLSIVVVDDIRVFRGLESRIKYMIDTEWVSLESLDLEDIKKKLGDERARIRTLRKVGSREDLVKTALLIVESPNKARTIASFFGKPSMRELPNGLRAYEVSTGDYILTITASGGHVYDLIVDQPIEDDLQSKLDVEETMHGVFKTRDNRFIPVYTTIKRCVRSGMQTTKEVNECPPVQGLPDTFKNSLKVVGDLRRLAWEADIVLLGTDPDTEGEKISRDLYLLIRPYSQRIERLEFHEVTKRAIMRALKELRKIDENLVNAQMVRRLEDRWIGFTLSPRLWYEFWPKYCKDLEMEAKGEKSKNRETNDLKICRRFKFYMNLSAGRVQTPTLGWIVARTKEYESSITTRYTIEFADGKGRLWIYGNEAPGMVPSILRSKEPLKIKVNAVEEEERTVNPPPSFTTDEMITEASKRLRLTAPRIMRLAQNLFELGLITYHRTDSHRISDKGKQIAKDYLEEKYGEGRLPEVYQPRSWGDGGAHEAIRPTRPLDMETLRNLIEEGFIELAAELTWNHYRLYDLVFRRFIASQMKPAKVVYREYQYLLNGILLKEEEHPYKTIELGFLDAYPEIRPVGLEEGEYSVEKIDATRVSRVPLYNDGEVVRLMKERGIGRPSTYAKIIDTLVKRRYVYVIPKTGQLIATKRGDSVYRYLMNRFSKLVSEERTRIVEEKMKMVEEGKADRNNVLSEVYEEIKPIDAENRRRKWTAEKAAAMVEEGLGNL
ncbi:MAG: reverse gyrase [Desulfurococcales archaeon]|nr:reverse gyrase [Desulfurococcales archaeon]